MSVIRKLVGAALLWGPVVFLVVISAVACWPATVGAIVILGLMVLGGYLLYGSH